VEKFKEVIFTYDAANFHYFLTKKKVSQNIEAFFELSSLKHT